nr:hypothetical protein CFP56_09210 [Quercus suber]POE77566.1 hypothetical protein CFP56_09213 [Quercus suber]
MAPSTAGKRAAGTEFQKGPDWVRTLPGNKMLVGLKSHITGSLIPKSSHDILIPAIRFRDPLVLIFSDAKRVTRDSEIAEQIGLYSSEILGKKLYAK